MRNKTKWLAYATCAGMLLVLLMGALVTKTESGRGCGDDWPLCNGKFVPAYTIESMIEWSHRFVTGIVGLLMLAATIQVLRRVRRADARFYVLWAAFFTVFQAMMGAFAVLWPQSSAVLALHFGFSLLAFAGTLLLAIAVREWAEQPDGGTNAGERKRESLADDRGAAVSPGLKFGIWFVTVYCYVVVYIGAFVRHTESYAGCGGWPLCNGEWIPELSGATGIMFGHRVAALVLFILVALLYGTTRGLSGFSRTIRDACGWAFALIVLQVLSGAFVTFTLGSDWNLLASLLHTLLVSALFGVLSYLCALTVLSPGTARAAAERAGFVRLGHKD